MPLAVILVVPMCLLCSIVGVRYTGSDINIFTQIGFVVLVGLASKNAILIVEFAKQQRAAGVPRREATLEACRLRLRPIVMTSFAFILGVLPLIVSQGAGAEMRQALGVAVFSGMLGVTLFGLALTPVFFFTVDWFGESRLFALPWLRKVNSAVLGALSLRPARQLGRRWVRQALATRRRSRKLARAKAAAEPMHLQPVEPMIPDTVVMMIDETVQVPGMAHEAGPPRPKLRSALLRRK